MVLLFEKHYTTRMKASSVSARPTKSSHPVTTAVHPGDEDLNFQELIARRAYELWQKNGSPDGHETNFWLEAERQLRAETVPIPPVVSRKSARTRRSVAADDIDADEVNERLDDFGEPPRRSATSVDLT